MAQIIRMTEEDLKNIITESVIRILNEDDAPSAWQAFKTGLNPKGIAKYAVDRLYYGGSEHKIDEDPEKIRKTKELKDYDDWKTKTENHGKTIEDYINSQQN